MLVSGHSYTRQANSSENKMTTTLSKDSSASSSPASSIEKLFSQPLRYFISACFFLMIFLVALVAESDYTRTTIVEATVIGKAEQQQEYRPTDYSLVVRNPDNALQTIAVSAAAYQGVAVGDELQVATSPKLRGVPRPGIEDARFILLGILLLATVVFFVNALVSLVSSATVSK